jgi:hypothetical protein
VDFVLGCCSGPFGVRRMQNFELLWRFDSVERVRHE